MKKLIIFMFLSVQITVGFGQTVIQGMINSNVTLTKEESPYLVAGYLVVFPKWKLTINPGVEIRVADGVKIEIRGALEALGTETDSISFISHTGTAMGLWDGIEIVYGNEGIVSFDYCKFSHAYVAIKSACCWGDIKEIKNSHFTYNKVAIYGYTKSINNTLIENCYFAFNEICIQGGSKIINNCVFEKNDYGIHGALMVDVSNSFFSEHTFIALIGCGDTKLFNCIITNNNIGVSDKFEIENCYISNNYIGVELFENYHGFSPIINSKICNNILYNVMNYSKRDADLYDVCWCSSDSTTVEDLIYDAYDDLSVGFVNFTLFTEDCSKKIFKTIKEENRSEYYNISTLPNNETVIYPNPALSTLYINNSNKINTISIYDHSGRLLIERSGFDNELIEINVSDLISGFYIVRLLNMENKIEFKKVIIAK